MTEQKEEFTFVYIPTDTTRPIEEWKQKVPPGKEVECLLDRLKEHFKATKPAKSVQQLAAQRAQFLGNLPAGTDVDNKLLDIATSLQMVETVSLLSHTKDNKYIGINMYVDDEGALIGAQTNFRATEIAHCCGLPIEVKGDAFLARVLDDGDAFERMDLTLGEVSSSASWVKEAQRQQEERRKRDTSGDGLIARMQKTTESSKIKELTPAEAAKEDGNSAFKKGDWSAAEEAYTKALELDSKLIAARNNRAMALLKMERWADAESDLNLVLEADSVNIKALLRRATARQELGRKDEAKKDLEQVLALQPANAEAKEKLTQLLA